MIFSKSSLLFISRIEKKNFFWTNWKKSFPFKAFLRKEKKTFYVLRQSFHFSDFRKKMSRNIFAQVNSKVGLNFLSISNNLNLLQIFFSFLSLDCRKWLKSSKISFLLDPILNVKFENTDIAEVQELNPKAAFFAEKNVFSTFAKVLLLSLDE